MAVSHQDNRTLSVHQEHELLLKLEGAGLNEPLAQAIIVSKYNVLAGTLLELAGQAGVRDRVVQDLWVERERKALDTLARAGLPKIDIDIVAGAWTPDLTLHHRFQPAGLTQVAGLEIAKAVGLKINGDSVKTAQYTGAEIIPTECGIFELDMETFMRPTNREGHPFVLNFDQQVEWAVAQGGEGLFSVEEGIYNGFLRPFVELELIPIMGGFIRTRNDASSAGYSSGLFWYFGRGLSVYYSDRDNQFWHYGAGVRKFKSVA